MTATGFRPKTTVPTAKNRSARLGLSRSRNPADSSPDRRHRDVADPVGVDVPEGRPVAVRAGAQRYAYLVDHDRFGFRYPDLRDSSSPHVRYEKVGRLLQAHVDVRVVPAALPYEVELWKVWFRLVNPGRGALTVLGAAEM